MFDEERTKRSLQTLQTSASNENALVGKHRYLQKRDMVKGTTNPLPVQFPHVYEDHSNRLSSQGSIESLNDSVDEASLLMSESVSEEYWKNLAEERRLALEDSLTENEELHKEIGELHTENDRLHVIAGQAEYLATVLKELIDEDDNPELSEIVTETSILLNQSSDAGASYHGDNTRLQRPTVQNADNDRSSDTSNH